MHAADSSMIKHKLHRYSPKQYTVAIIHSYSGKNKSTDALSASYLGKRGKASENMLLIINLLRDTLSTIDMRYNSLINLYFEVSSSNFNVSVKHNSLLLYSPMLKFQNIYPLSEDNSEALSG